MGDATPDDATVAVDRTGTASEAIAEPVDLRLAQIEVPAALAELHRRLAPGPAAIEARIADTGWGGGRLDELAEGAGFELQSAQGGERSRPSHHPGDGRTVRLRRLDTLSDTVGANMRLLICGLNPSPYSAEVGVGFGRPGNRFWPAVRAAGLITIEANDPIDSLIVDRVGMTDLVKRVTRRADEVTTAEYGHGLDRVERLVAWLEPMAVCFVGLAGWRASVDRRATAGIQDRTIGNRPVYLMPSTSGLNASATVAGLTEHFRSAGRLADDSTP